MSQFFSEKSLTCANLKTENILIVAFIINVPAKFMQDALIKSNLFLNDNSLKDKLAGTFLVAKFSPNRATFTVLNLLLVIVY